ncbi:hypothetical protein MKW98_028677 [Papaver atlanticum]|uniref:Uncharacterized protein n=1 Tax=Papaver atlanticum TaxID=357466 RepID=A0AAD4S4H1_9MAGN|nr:hypothetical protein MKW98_028677 [Papaver atlanticum]
MANKRKIGAYEVISQLKDDGDFDKLRVSIIQRVKGNEEQRSDAIFDEMGNTVMTQIFDALWETVIFVYNQLLNPKWNEVDESSFLIGPRRRDNIVVNNNNSLLVYASETEHNLHVSQYVVDSVKVKEESYHENDTSQFKISYNEVF